MHDIELEDQWSIDILLDESGTYWLTDMALAQNSTYWDESKNNKGEEIMKKIIATLLIMTGLIGGLFGCSSVASETNEKLNTNTTQATGASAKIITNQPAPTDLDYSLERYNLIKRAYFVNGQKEKAMSLPCPVSKPLGYIVLFSDSGAIVGSFTVDGKVSSLSSYLFPACVDQDNTGDTAGNGAGYGSGVYSVEIPGIDGAYGSNAEGIFFFTAGTENYIEWSGKYLYSDIPFKVDDPVLKVGK